MLIHIPTMIHQPVILCYLHQPSLTTVVTLYHFIKLTPQFIFLLQLISNLGSVHADSQRFKSLSEVRYLKYELLVDTLCTPPVTT